MKMKNSLWWKHHVVLVAVWVVCVAVYIAFPLPILAWAKVALSMPLNLVGDFYLSWGFLGLILSGTAFYDFAKSIANVAFNLKEWS